jgi:hypothetical protein
LQPSTDKNEGLIKNKTTFSLWLDFTLQALKEQPLCLQLVEEIGVEHEDGVVEDVAEG